MTPLSFDEAEELDTERRIEEAFERRHSQEVR